MEEITNNSNILVVDDVPKNLQVLGNILKENNYQIEFALDGPTAIKWIEKKDFDLVLLDIRMPGMTGFDVCKHIRAIERFNNLPIIFLTANADKESVVEGFEMGGQDYITKPFDSNELLARVHTHLELKNSRDALKNMNTILEEKVEERTLQLKDANLKLQKLDKAKSTFIHIISHEIRTPLNGILGGLSLIKDYGLTEETQDFLSILDDSALRLEKFSHQALDISVFSSEQKKVLSKKPDFLENLMQLTINQYNKELNEKNLSVNLNSISDEIIELDSLYIKKVNDSILDNAIKFSSPNTEIEIKIWKEEDFMHLRIVDQGEEFDKDFKIENIIPFDSKNHVDQNPGLSLYLCRLIIEAHGGKIWNGNNENIGAFVEYKLPRK